ncbi:MAG: hypothetical protein JO002_04675 [Burkholderiaceae bacterium]|nr:hypothetical protein [Burkholderiaceae bacterium]
MNILALRSDRFSRRMVYCWLALVFFGTSLLLPSFDYIIFGVHYFVPGWSAAWFALCGSFEGIVHPRSDVTGYFGFFAAGLAAIANLVFIAAPFILRRRPLAGRRQLILGTVVAVGLILGIVSALSFEYLLEHLLIGYQLWLCAYAVLAVAILSAWIEDRAAKPTQ